MLATRYALALAVGALLPHVAGAQSTDDPIVGVWRTYDDKTGRPEGLIRIVKVQGQYVGSIDGGSADDDPNARCTACRGTRHNQPMLGLVILEGLQRDGTLTYTGGRILDPDTGSTWNCDIQVKPDGRSLEIHGFIGLRLFGRSQTWKREGG